MDSAKLFFAGAYPFLAGAYSFLAGSYSFLVLKGLQVTLFLLVDHHIHSPRQVSDRSGELSHSLL